MDECPDGAWFVDFAAIDEPALVPQAVASALGIEEGQGGGLNETLVRRIGSKSELIILDNCEHLVSACAELSAALLRACPDLRLLATSREPLRVPGEVAWSVPPLSFPSDDQSYSAEDLLRFESVQLFVDRATKARSDFGLTNRSSKSGSRCLAKCLLLKSVKSPANLWGEAEDSEFLSWSGTSGQVEQQGA